nr:immunoglobulin heavy chain junction region [Mus musculus]
YCARRAYSSNYAMDY